LYKNGPSGLFYVYTQTGSSFALFIRVLLMLPTVSFLQPCQVLACKFVALKCRTLPASAFDCHCCNGIIVFLCIVHEQVWPYRSLSDFVCQVYLWYDSCV